MHAKLVAGTEDDRHYNLETIKIDNTKKNLKYQFYRVGEAIFTLRESRTC
jgi:hypothetical protein